jgi:hypothetical protein
MATIITSTDIGANLGFTGSPLKLAAREQLRGNNYIVVYGNNNTTQQNGIELFSKLNFAKISTPNGLPLSDKNRMTVIVAPGVYILPVSIDWLDMDTPYINLVSLTGEADVSLISLNSATAIKVTTSDIKIKGFNLTEQSNNIIIEGAYSNNYFENIIGGDYNFSNGTFRGQVAGNFKNCVGGNQCFADINNEEMLISSTLENCTASDFSFGLEIVESTLINCLAGAQSFGYKSIISSYLTDCTARGESFGCASGIFGSTLTNCTAGDFSFGRTDLLGQPTIIEKSQLNNCKAGVNSFSVGNVDDSSFINCVGGDESFGANIANSIYKNCKGGNNSFGAGQLLSWPDLTAGGNFYNCEAGDGSFGINISNGNYYYCIAGGDSFTGRTQGGMGGYAAYCKGMNPTSSGSSTAIYCTDATNNPVNYGLGSTTNNI